MRRGTSPDLGRSLLGCADGESKLREPEARRPKAEPVEAAGAVALGTQSDRSSLSTHMVSPNRHAKFDVNGYEDRIRKVALLVVGLIILVAVALLAWTVDARLVKHPGNDTRILNVSLAELYDFEGSWKAIVQRSCAGRDVPWTSNHPKGDHRWAHFHCDLDDYYIIAPSKTLFTPGNDTLLCIPQFMLPGKHANGGLFLGAILLSGLCFAFFTNLVFLCSTCASHKYSQMQSGQFLYGRVVADTLMQVSFFAFHFADVFDPQVDCYESLAGGVTHLFLTIAETYQAAIFLDVWFQVRFGDYLARFGLGFFDHDSGIDVVDVNPDFGVAEGPGGVSQAREASRVRGGRLCWGCCRYCSRPATSATIAARGHRRFSSGIQQQPSPPLAVAATSSCCGASTMLCGVRPRHHRHRFVVHGTLVSIALLPSAGFLALQADGMATDRLCWIGFDPCRQFAVAPVALFFGPVGLCFLVGVWLNWRAGGRLRRRHGAAHLLWTQEMMAPRLALEYSRDYTTFTFTWLFFCLAVFIVVFWEQRLHGSGTATESGWYTPISLPLMFITLVISRSIFTLSHQVNGAELHNLLRCLRDGIFTALRRCCPCLRHCLRHCFRLGGHRGGAGRGGHGGAPWPASHDPFLHPAMAGGVFASKLDVRFLLKDEKFSAGAQGQVFKGRYKHHGAVCIKEIYSYCGEDWEQPDVEIVDKFYHEIAILSRTCHPNIVQFIGYAQDETKAGLYIVTELMRGGTLVDVLQDQRLYSNGGCMAQCIQLSILRQIAGAFAYLHEMNIIHRDVKPANILVDRAFRVKICDFGLARMLPTSTSRSSSGSSGSMMTTNRGTYGYQAPEMADARYREHVDVYPFGIIMWQLEEHSVKLPSSKRNEYGREVFDKPPYKWSRPYLVYGTHAVTVDDEPTAAPRAQGRSGETGMLGRPGVPGPSAEAKKSPGPGPAADLAQVSALLDEARARVNVWARGTPEYDRWHSLVEEYETDLHVIQLRLGQQAKKQEAEAQARLSVIVGLRGTPKEQPERATRATHAAQAERDATESEAAKAAKRIYDRDTADMQRNLEEARGRLVDCLPGSREHEECHGAIEALQTELHLAKMRLGRSLRQNSTTDKEGAAMIGGAAAAVTGAFTGPAEEMCCGEVLGSSSSRSLDAHQIQESLEKKQAHMQSLRLNSFDVSVSINGDYNDPMSARTRAYYVQLASACWDTRPSRRPKFPQIVEALEKMDMRSILHFAAVGTGRDPAALQSAVHQSRG